MNRFCVSSISLVRQSLVTSLVQWRVTLAFVLSLLIECLHKVSLHTASISVSLCLSAFVAAGHAYTQCPVGRKQLILPIFIVSPLYPMRVRRMVLMLHVGLRHSDTNW